MEKAVVEKKESNIIMRFCRFFTSYMAIFVALAGLVGALWPATFKWVGPQISWMLGLVMFGMGMTLTFDDVKMVAKRPWEIGIGALAQFTIMPLVAYALAKCFGLPPELAVGVILVGTCPGGTASNVMAYLAKGDVALSVAMTMTTTILAPVVTPVLTYYLAGAWVEISLYAMMISIAKMVLLPVILGLLMNHFCSSLVRKIVDFLPFFSSVVIALIVGGVVALSASKLFSYGPLIMVVVILHNGFGLLLGYYMAKLFHLDDRKARTISIEVGLQNSGMAAALSVMYFSAAAAIPGAIFSVWHNVAGSVLANYFARKEEAAGGN